MDVFEAIITMFFADERDAVEESIGIYTTQEKAEEAQRTWMVTDDNREWTESAISFHWDISTRKLE